MIDASSFSALLALRRDLLGSRPVDFCKCDRAQTSVERTGVLRCEICGRPTKAEKLNADR